MILNSVTVNNNIFHPGSLWLSGALLETHETIRDFFVDWGRIFQKALPFDTPKMKSDDQCVKGIANGEEAPFQILFERYGDLVFGYCVKLLKDRERAEDASQEVWVKVINNANRFKTQGKFRSWLLQIARNTCFSVFRELKKNFADDVIDHEIEDTTQKSILDLMSVKEDQTNLRNCINELPESQRVALVIWMTEDKSYEEIAKEMKTSVPSVKSLIFRSRQSLKGILGELRG